MPCLQFINCHPVYEAERPLQPFKSKGFTSVRVEIYVDDLGEITTNVAAKADQWKDTTAGWIETGVAYFQYKNGHLISDPDGRDMYVVDARDGLTRYGFNVHRTISLEQIQKYAGWDLVLPTVEELVGEWVRGAVAA